MVPRSSSDEYGRTMGSSYGRSLKKATLFWFVDLQRTSTNQNDKLLVRLHSMSTRVGYTTTKFSKKIFSNPSIALSLSGIVFLGFFFGGGVDYALVVRRRLKVVSIYGGRALL